MSQLVTCRLHFLGFRRIQHPILEVLQLGAQVLHQRIPLWLINRCEWIPTTTRSFLELPKTRTRRGVLTSRQEFEWFLNWGSAFVDSLSESGDRAEFVDWGLREGAGADYTEIES